jgi:hypothetical protein
MARTPGCGVGPPPLLGAHTLYWSNELLFDRLISLFCKAPTHFGFRPLVSNRHTPAPALFHMISFKELSYNDLHERTPRIGY